MSASRFFPFLALVCHTVATTVSNPDVLFLAKQKLTCTNEHPPNYACGTFGELQHPQLIRHFSKLDSGDCLAKCLEAPACVSFGFGNNEVCSLYSETIFAQGLTAYTSSNVAFYNRHCFNCVDTEPTSASTVTVTVTKPAITVTKPAVTVTKSAVTVTASGKTITATNCSSPETVVELSTVLDAVTITDKDVVGSTHTVVEMKTEVRMATDHVTETKLETATDHVTDYRTKISDRTETEYRTKISDRTETEYRTKIETDYKACPVNPATATYAMDSALVTVTYTQSSIVAGSTISYTTQTTSTTFAGEQDNLGDALSTCIFVAAAHAGNDRGDFNLYWHDGEFNYWSCVAWVDDGSNEHEHYVAVEQIGCGYHYQEPQVE